MRDAAGEAPFRDVLSHHFAGHFQMHLNHPAFRQLSIRGEVNPMITDIHGGGFVFRVSGLLHRAEPQWDLHDQTACTTALLCRHWYPLDLGLYHFWNQAGRRDSFTNAGARGQAFSYYSQGASKG